MSLISFFKSLFSKDVVEDSNYVRLEKIKVRLMNLMKDGVCVKDHLLLFNVCSSSSGETTAVEIFIRNTGYVIDYVFGYGLASYAVRKKTDSNMMDVIEIDYLGKEKVHFLFTNESVKEVISDIENHILSLEEHVMFVRSADIPFPICG